MLKMGVFYLNQFIKEHGIIQKNRNYYIKINFKAI